MGVPWERWKGQWGTLGKVERTVGYPGKGGKDSGVPWERWKGQWGYPGKGGKDSGGTLGKVERTVE